MMSLRDAQVFGFGNLELMIAAMNMIVNKDLNGVSRLGRRSDEYRWESLERR